MLQLLQISPACLITPPDVTSALWRKLLQLSAAREEWDTVVRYLPLGLCVSFAWLQHMNLMPGIDLVGCGLQLFKGWLAFLQVYMYASCGQALCA